MSLKDLSFEDWNLLCDRVSVTDGWIKDSEVREEFRDIVSYHRKKLHKQRAYAPERSNFTYSAMKQAFSVRFDKIPLEIRKTTDFWLAVFKFRLEVGK